MKVNILILAGGLGTRMKSSLPKVMHSICGKPILEYIVNTSKMADPSRIVLLIGNGSQRVRQHFESADMDILQFAYQKEQLGTGDALRSAAQYIEKNSVVIILSGDVPLITYKTIDELLKDHKRRKSTITVLSMLPDDPTGYGRIIRNKDDLVTGIVEHKDADNDQKQIKEVNAGIYCIESDFIEEYIDELNNDNAQGEYYLTDLIGIAHRNNMHVHSHIIGDKQEVLGINNRYQLSEIEDIMLGRIRQHMMNEGVTMRNPETIYIESTVTVGRDSVIEPCTVLKGKTILGEGCSIGAFSYLENVVIKDGEIIKPYTKIIE